MSKKRKMCKQTDVYKQYLGETFFNMPATPHKYRARDRQKLKLVFQNEEIEETLKKHEKLFWKTQKPSLFFG